MRRLRAGLLALLGLGAIAAVAAEVDRSTMLDAEEARAWRGVGRVNIGGLRSRGLCTGTLIAPDVVLTAAHCVVQGRTGKPYRPDTIHFVAGWYKGEMTGHSVAAGVAVHPFYRPDVRNTAFDLAHDVALIRLRDPMPAEAALPFDVAAPPRPGAPVVVLSYRRDRPNALTYQDDCRYEDRDGPVLVLLCNATSGASGAPVFVEVDGEEREVGMLVAVSNGGGPARAFAVRADAAVANLLPRLAEAGSGPAVGEPIP